MSWQDGQTHFAFLHPTPSYRGSVNDRSCVLLVYHGASQVLLTGDLEAPGESLLAARLRKALAGHHSPGTRASLDVDMMTAPHHGSRTSSTGVLLDVLQPRYVVFPSGNGNRYGFPHADVQLRYENLGAVPYITGTEGAVSFAFTRSGLDHPPLTWRHSHRRFWHGKL
jgi:competence protein ComEC